MDQIAVDKAENDPSNHQQAWHEGKQSVLTEVSSQSVTLLQVVQGIDGIG